MTRTVYTIEHFFEHLSEHKRVHWMWCPAIGAVAVGVIGYFRPDTLGPGYFNLNYLLSDHVVAFAAISLCVLKFLSWSISLGSGTAGGTLAPVFTIGGSLGAALSILFARLFPHVQLDPRIAALVGMSAIFAGASRALLTSAVFAFETTLEPLGIAPALCGCSAAYLVSSLLMRHSIMSVKMAQQGVRVPAEYVADTFASISVREAATASPITLRGEQSLREVRHWINSNQPGSQHQGYPVIESSGLLLGIVTRRDLLNPKSTPQVTIAELIHRPPVIVYADSTLREAADHMANHNIGRLPVIDRTSRKLVGILTRGDLLASRGRQLKIENEAKSTLAWRRRRTSAQPTA